MFNLLLDVRTLSYVNMMAALAIGFAMVFIWRTRKTYPGFVLWIIANFASIAGYFLLSWRDLWPDWITVLAANLLIFLYPLFVYEGIRGFLGRASRKWLILGLVVGMGAILLFFTYVDNNITVRTVAISGLSAVMFGLCAYEMFSSSSRPIPSSYQFTAAYFIVYAIFSLVRATITWLTPPLQNLFEPNWLQSLVFLFTLPFGFIWTIGIMILNHERLEHELTNAQSKLRQLAITDSLTGVYNIRHFYEIGEHSSILSRQRQDPLSVVIIDVDNFKHINDTYGHPVGDQILMHVAGICQKCLRDGDVFSRLGGDEFGVLLHKTDLDRGEIVAGRLRSVIASTGILVDDMRIYVSISTGVSEVIPEEEGIKPALKRADSALYTAKRSRDTNEPEIGFGIGGE
jgi:diguanylate cyclase (GGDEF)-like protein